MSVLCQYFRCDGVCTVERTSSFLIPCLGEREMVERGISKLMGSFGKGCRGRIFDTLSLAYMFSASLWHDGRCGGSWSWHLPLRNWEDVVVALKQKEVVRCFQVHSDAGWGPLQSFGANATQPTSWRKWNDYKSECNNLVPLLIRVSFRTFWDAHWTACAKSFWDLHQQRPRRVALDFSFFISMWNISLSSFWRSNSKEEHGLFD